MKVCSGLESAKTGARKMESLLATKILAPRVEPNRSQPGADQLISYDQLVRFVDQWSEHAGVVVSVAGESKAGRKIFLIAISHPENLYQVAGYSKRARDSWKSLVRYPSLGAPEKSKPDLDSLVSLAKPALLVHAGGFGFEASHTEAACQLIERLLANPDKESQEILRGSVVLVMPMVNPDSRELALEQWKTHPLAPGWQGVGNSYGFIMNRDFYCLTQPENQAVHRVLNEWRPLMALDLHEDMGFLGARLDDTCWVPPFRDPRHKNLDAKILERVAEYSAAIAERWRKEGFQVWHDPKGAFMSYMVLDGRCDMHLDLHGIPCLFTESARTPGSQTWEDRNRQKLTAALAFLHKASGEYAQVLKTEYDYWAEQIRLGTAGPNYAFVIPRSSANQRDPRAADNLASKLAEHDIQVYATDVPYPAYVVPLGQPDRNLILAMLQVEPWNALSLPPALGVECLKFEALAPEHQQALLKAKLGRVTDVRHFWTKSPKRSAHSKVLFAGNTESSVKLVNFSLLAGLDVKWLSEPAGTGSEKLAAGTFCITDRGGLAQDFARAQDLVFTAGEQLSQFESVGISLPKIAVYTGQGADEKNHTSTGETLWALDFLGFPYSQLSEQDIRQGLLDGFDVLILGNGAAVEMVDGWNVKTQNYMPPWQVPGETRGLGTEGLAQITRFIERGGRYIGISSGGGALACKELAAIADVTIADQALGQARIYLRVEDARHPVMWGYDGFRDQDGAWHPQEVPAFYFCDQLWPRAENLSGPVFKAGPLATTLASFDRADYEAWTEYMERPPESLNRSHAAIVFQRVGKGSVVLFGITLGFRAQWISNYRLLSNAIYSWQLA
jgi:glutamine amidotransferase-like uncharacterized protein